MKNVHDYGKSHSTSHVCKVKGPNGNDVQDVFLLSSHMVSDFEKLSSFPTIHVLHFVAQASTQSRVIYINKYDNLAFWARADKKESFRSEKWARGS